MALIAAVFVILGVGHTGVTPGPRTFRASFAGAAVHDGHSSYVSAAVGERLSLRIEVDPGPETLDEPEIDIDGPMSIVFGGCTSRIGGESHAGYVDGSVAHIRTGDLDIGETDRVTCELSVERRIPRQKTIDISLSATNQVGTEERRLYLEKSDGQSGREAAETLIEDELRPGPAAWSRSSFVRHQNAVIGLGREWSLLSPQGLQGFRSLPPGRKTTLAHLWANRAQPAGLIDLEAVIEEPPVVVATLEVGPKALRANREVFAIGETGGETMAWCATTRSTAQPDLREGEHVHIEAAVLGFAISQTSHGWAAMIDCPAVREVGRKGFSRHGTEHAGAMTAPTGSGE